MIPSGCVEKCRGCKHREWSMDESLTQKYNFLKTKLALWNDVLEIVRSVDNIKRWRYRSKTTLSTYYDGAEWHFGMKARDELIPIPHCPVHSNVINETMNVIRNSIPKSNNFQLTFVVQSNAQVVLVIKSKKIPDLSWVDDNLKSKLKTLGVEGLWIHLNPSTGKRIFEKSEWQLLWGRPQSLDYNNLCYGPAAFQQLIPELYNESLKEACRFFEIAEQDAIIDLYCGTGNSMKQWSNAGATVLGIELGGDAVRFAKINVPQATTLRGACRQRVPQIDSWTKEERANGKRIMMYANPPRTGLEIEVLDWIVKEGRPSKIAYLSCSPGTLYKNIHLLTQHGYSVKKLIPFDFFPQTIHVECLALLEL